jgi:predicted adenylyl cyclase CyaB
LPTNIEIKATVHDLEQLRAVVEKLCGQPGKVIQQHDVFFHVHSGRLKLRFLSEKKGELIYYQRLDTLGPKQSNYSITQTHDPAQLQSTLSQALGILGTVKKTRWLYKTGQTRVHLDRVEHLGDFMELEVVLRPDQMPEEGQDIAYDIMNQLQIQKKDLLACAYIDLLDV